MIKAVLFDLDGTLLPMDQDEFVKGYFGLLAKKAAPYGYETEKLIKTVWAGTAAMVKNDGKISNETAFWNKFAEIYGKDALKDREMFDDFYANEFNQGKNCCGFNPKAAETVQAVKGAGLRTALATNPIFPETATRARIRWAGLKPEDFEFFTTYENSCTCKPNPEYFRDVARRMRLSPEECLMAGNDISEDSPAKETGMDLFIVTDCLINKENRDINIFPHGGFDELMQYIRSKNCPYG